MGSSQSIVNSEPSKELEVVSKGPKIKETEKDPELNEVESSRSSKDVSSENSLLVRAITKLQTEGTGDLDALSSQVTETGKANLSKEGQE